MPVYKQLLCDKETPVSLFMDWGMDHAEDSVLLESVIAGETLGRNSFLARDPFIVLKGKKGVFQLTERAEDGRTSTKEITSSDPLKVLEDTIGSLVQVVDPRLPSFQGGAIGFLGYDAIRYYEKIQDIKPDLENHPDAYFAIYHNILIVDHINHTVKILANADIRKHSTLDESYQATIESIRRIESEVFENPKPHDSIVISNPDGNPLEFVNVMGDDDYIEAIAKAKKHIYDGDIFQIVPSRKIRFQPDVPSFQIYRALRAVNPSPYMYFVKTGSLQLVGSSPEILVKHSHSVTTLRPIAGTRPRGKDRQEDEHLAADLLADKKEIAEHIMLVDLGRNDLGRISQPGTVKVQEFKIIEMYSHVMHIVSQCIGKIRADKTVYDVIRATLPAGTLSGAPKIRAMELIDELENNHRGIYGGGLGYISFAGEMDMAIIIRTIIIDDKGAYLQAGGGIVYDSDPETELQETKNKMAGMLKALEYARAGLRGELR
ncbi:anthranilate synthase component I [Leptospira sp. GIMC2001]|uniref:anthranilate synthase component I n=1 Tax=Leptospira sp. GIMC2001 TaxID=1513297 RepID=UPI00234BE175|nr:anthranilate synthase component I [Leptospira sp. GIMC2001]WCL51290.1 anthranilate synthase component I [Leptospira sp. GIMC2001]